MSANATGSGPAEVDLTRTEDRPDPAVEGRHRLRINLREFRWDSTGPLPGGVINLGGLYLACVVFFGALLAAPLVPEEAAVDVCVIGVLLAFIIVGATIILALVPGGRADDGLRRRDRTGRASGDGESVALFGHRAPGKPEQGK